MLGMPAPWWSRSRARSVQLAEQLALDLVGIADELAAGGKEQATTPATCGGHAGAAELDVGNRSLCRGRRPAGENAIACATTSGLQRPSAVGPRELKYDTPYWCGWSLWTEPTAMDSSRLAGSPIDKSMLRPTSRRRPAFEKPSLPAAKITTTPCRHRSRSRCRGASRRSRTPGDQKALRG